MTVKIGMMSFAHLHANSYASCVNQLPDAELVGIADDDGERARAMAACFHTRAFGGYSDLLASDIEAVIIASENARHRELTEMAAATGKHVLSEKPLATTAADGLAMISACRKAGVFLMTAFPCRFSPAMQRLKAACDAGKIGTIVAIRGTNRGTNPGGWFTQKKLSGGGAVMDHTVHVTDLMRWLTGSEVADVYAEIGNGFYHQDYDDAGFLTMTFENGIFATLDASWSRTKSFPFWGDVTMAVVGEGGVLTLDMFSQNIVHYSDTDMRVYWHNWGSNVDLALIGAFVQSVANHTVPPITGEDGLRAAEVAFAAYQSAEEGAPVKVKRN